MNNSQIFERKPCQIFSLLLNNSWQPTNLGIITCKLIEKGCFLRKSFILTLVAEESLTCVITLFWQIDRLCKISMFGFVSSGCNTWNVHSTGRHAESHHCAAKGLGEKEAQFMLLLMKIKPL